MADDEGCAGVLERGGKHFDRCGHAFLPIGTV
jgi:hypothetical protein